VLIGTDNIAVQGIDYPATIPEFFEGGDDAGASLLVNYTARAETQCPDSKVVVSGYRYIFYSLLCLEKGKD
jgi:cutinase